MYPLAVSLLLLSVFSCTSAQQVFPCVTGQQACRFAGSFSSNGNDNVRCCPQGYSISSFGGFAYGQYINSCTCSLGGRVNPAFGRAMGQWGQQFANSMQNMGSNLANMFRGFGFFG
ncbi:uncharacterized protein [Littorina saxatilis]|uniref:Uncharacterized protein n=1 Tax=Littorina saxatilis TaxID=31220 RepID=A0AAN9BU04_9CAEN